MCEFVVISDEWLMSTISILILYLEMNTLNIELILGPMHKKIILIIRVTW